MYARCQQLTSPTNIERIVIIFVLDIILRICHTAICYDICGDMIMMS